ncbi:hypothetical protein KGQ55_01660 [Patescibacteria group bacterium]|nr:hypothetical protein [Patescibacteria group bacterium]
MRTRLFRKPRRFIPPAVALRFAALALVVALVVLWRFALPGSFLFAVAPIAQVGTAAANGVSGLAALFADRTALSGERDALAQELASVTEERDTLAAQLTDLTRHEGGLPAFPPGMLASVLIRPPMAPYDSLVVEVGDGVSVADGELALADGGTPVGTVTSVDGRFARIALFSSSGTKTSVLVGASRTPATLTGTGAGGFSFSLPRSLSGPLFAKGDAVYFSYGGLRPIGTIAAVTNNPESTSVSYLVQGVANPFSLTWLSLVSYPAP